MVQLQSNPLFLPQFAKECVNSIETIQQFHPNTIQDVLSFQLHRDTRINISCKPKSSECYSGNNELHQSVDIRFGDFINYYIASYHNQTHWLHTLEDLDFYLCQCPIAVYDKETNDEVALPQIMQEFTIPQLMNIDNLSQINLWMTVNSSRTSLHYDAYQNILLVLYGCKRVTLYPPSDTKYLYAQSSWCKPANHSIIQDNFPPTNDNFPLFKHATPHVFQVKAGDALYIPEGWWHQVDSDAYTIAINYWFHGLRKELISNTNMSPYYLRIVMDELTKEKSKEYLFALKQKVLLSSREIIKDQHDEMSDTKILQILTSATTTQEIKEDILMSLSVECLQNVQHQLVQNYCVVWKSLLEYSSTDFAAYITDFWETHETLHDSIVVMFQTFGDDAESIRQNLKALQDKFMKARCIEALQDNLGLLGDFNQC